MIGGLPELFGKAFAIGFLVPAAAVALAGFGVLSVFGRDAAILAFVSEDKILGSTIALVFIWLLAIALMAVNRSVIRWLEGYGRLNPARLLGFLERRRFASLQQEIQRLTSTIEQKKTHGQVPDNAELVARARARQQMASDFPDDAAWLLPTRFGNAIRAFEVYPRVIYGLEGIQGWSRLAAIVPETLGRTIEETKAQMDFWINICFGGMLTLVSYGVLAALDGTCPQRWILVAAIAASYLSMISARAMAVEWGMLVMSAFDLYRGDLCVKLGFEMPRSIDVERQMWQTFSRAAIYRSKASADRFTGFRPRLGHSEDRS